MAPQAVSVDCGGKSVSIPTGLYINGEFVAAKAGKTFPSENPSTGKEVIQVQEGQAEDVDIAVRAARTCFESEAYAEFGTTNRAACLIKLADLMQESFEELVAIEMLDTGKTRTQAANLDVPASIGTLRYYAGWADKVLGQSNTDIPKVFAFTRREPVGVCGQIIPWNFPLLMFTWKIAVRDILTLLMERVLEGIVLICDSPLSPPATQS